jgi:aminopeptidase N
MMGKERSALAEATYKYRRQDFGELPVTLNHLTIYLNFLDDVVEATNVLDMTAQGTLDHIGLDAKDLTIVSVEWLDPELLPDAPGQAIGHQYKTEESRLIVRLPRLVVENDRFRVRTVTRCCPSDHILEGIYKDSTPPGAPHQYMSQCQQWGFQRIMPIFDDCRAKCTMTTTIEADAAYTHLISNGNISRDLNPDGLPILKPGDPSRKLIRYENPIPMAPYLFLVCCGTWDMLEDTVTLDSGKSVKLEYLVPPGRVDHVRIPMEILKQSVLWISRTQGYDYTMDTYRTICMNKSNFGGMENMGNTTIVTDAALIDEHTLDFTLLYVHAVIVHEFEHNQCGSETTMETPFDVWLNEAYTVDVERQFMADTFDPSFIRLTQVDSIRHPIQGPLAIEDGGRAGRIVRQAFNDPDELIDGVTYVKAAEVIRMLRLIVGKDNFLAGKQRYFTRYKFGNANTDQFFQCFEEVSGRSLEQFKSTWLATIGYPEISASTEYDVEKRQFTVRLSQQTGNNPAFHVPVAIALADSQGQTIPGTDTILELTKETGSVTFQAIPEAPAFASLNRDYSFYGTLKCDTADFDTLAMQARLDSNHFNRVEAMRQLTDRVRIKLLLNPESEIDTRWLSLYGDILSDQTLPRSLKAYLIRIEEQPLDRRYCAWYRELVKCRERLMLAVNRAYRDRLMDLFAALDTYKPRRSPKDGIEERILKHVLLDLLAVDDSSESHQLILGHYHAATTNSDRVSALLALNRSSSAARRDLLEQTYEAWHTHLSGYANYLRVVGSGTRDDAFDMIEAERHRPSFDLGQPTWARALFLSMAANNKMVWTDRGIDWVADTVIELAPINWFTGSRLLNTFQQVKRLKPDVQGKVRSALQRIAEGVPADVAPALHAQAMDYLG